MRSRAQSRPADGCDRQPGRRQAHECSSAGYLRHAVGARLEGSRPRRDRFALARTAPRRLDRVAPHRSFGKRAPRTRALRIVETVFMANPLELPAITGFGVTLRPWRPADAPALVEACGDQDIVRFTTVPGVYTKQATLDWIGRQSEHGDRGTAAVFAIVGPTEVRPVGMVGLFRLDQGGRTARLGFWLVAHARRRGSATAAARPLTGWAFDHLGLAQIVIDREPSNLASARVVEKLAQTRELPPPRNPRGSPPDPGCARPGSRRCLR